MVGKCEKTIWWRNYLVSQPNIAVESFHRKLKKKKGKNEKNRDTYE